MEWQDFLKHEAVNARLSPKEVETLLVVFPKPGTVLYQDRKIDRSQAKNLSLNKSTTNNIQLKAIYQKFNIEGKEGNELEQLGKQLNQKFDLQLYLQRPAKLVREKRFEEYGALLSDYDFIAAKVQHPEFGVYALIADYNGLKDAEISANLEPETVRVLQLIQGALRLSAHILIQEITQLAGQLWGRLLLYDLPAIQGLLAKAKQRQVKSWVRPRTTSLDPAGGVLRQTLSGHSNSITSIAVTKNNSIGLLGSCDGTVKVWDLQTGTECFSLEGHCCAVTSVAVTKDGSRVLSGSFDKTVKVWDLQTGAECFCLEGHHQAVTSVAVAEDNVTVLSGSRDGTVKVWDLRTGLERFTVYGHSKWVYLIAVLEGGSMALSGSSDGTIKVWDLQTGAERFSLNIRGSAAVTEDGSILLSGSYDKTIKVWDLQTGTERFSLPGNSSPVKVVALTKDGSIGLSGSSDGTVKVWDLQTGIERCTLRGQSSWTVTRSSESQVLGLYGRYPEVMSVALTEDGSTVLSGLDDGRVKVWDLQTGTARFCFKGHRDRVNSVTVTKDGSIVLSGSHDGMMKVWELQTGKEIGSFTVDPGMGSCAISPDGQTIVAGDVGGHVQFLQLESPERDL